MRILFNRHRFIQWLVGTSYVLALGTASAHHTPTHFEDDSAHHIVYQLNEADPKTISHVLFSAGELLRKYGDDVEIVVTVYAEGIHLLGKHPLRPIPLELQQKASSLAAYGVAFHACYNTMKSLHWTEKDMVDYAKIVPIGAEDIMLLQEKGFAYVAW